MPSSKQKKNGVDIALDASELEGMSEDDLRKKYDAANRGSAGVPGGRGEDFSDMVAQEMAKKKAKEQRDRERVREKKGKDSFKF